MQLNRLMIWVSAVCMLMVAAGCGKDHEFLAAVQVSPASGTAMAGSGNTAIQFTAIGWYAPLGSCGLGGCGLATPDRHQTLTNASWSTSDSVNTSVNSSGLATCLSPTSSPATVKATAPGGYFGSVQGTATLICN